MFLLRKLNSFNVSKGILRMVYTSLLESIISYNITCWYGNLGARSKSKITKIINIASKIILDPQRQLVELYTNQTRRKASQIVQDSTHPLQHEFEKLPSGRRYRVPIATRNIIKKSFIPSAVTLLNK